MQVNYIYPALALVGLTILVLFRIMQTRFTEMINKKINPQKVSLRKDMAILVLDARASDNFLNLFELPVLFYFLSIVILFFKIESHMLLICMWAFVSFRFIHSIIHCTYNKVMHRFYAFFVSTLFLILVFILTVVNIFSPTLQK